VELQCQRVALMVFQFNGAFLEFSVGQALFGDYDAKSLVVLPT
jgi:hypothetical protein